MQELLGKGLRQGCAGFHLVFLANQTRNHTFFLCLLIEGKGESLWGELRVWALLAKEKKNENKKAVASSCLALFTGSSVPSSWWSPWLSFALVVLWTCWGPPVWDCSSPMRVRAELCSPHCSCGLCPASLQEHLSVSHNSLTTLHGELSSLPCLRVSVPLCIPCNGDAVPKHLLATQGWPLVLLRGSAGCWSQAAVISFCTL